MQFHHKAQAWWSSCSGRGLFRYLHRHCSCGIEDTTLPISWGLSLLGRNKYVYRTCTKLQLFTFFHPAFEIQVGDSRRKKEADACIRPEQSCYPSVILEVGSSESLSQVEVDAQLWIEHVPEVRQSCLLLSPTHWNFFR